MKYTVTSRVRGVHAMFDCMILFCRANDKEAAGKRFKEIFKEDIKYLTIVEGWDFQNREAQELFSKKAMENLEKDFKPGGVYQELFGKLQRDWNAFPHYGFEYAEIRNEKESQDKIKARVCTEENPAPDRTDRGWPYIKSWNTKFSHPDADKKQFENTDSEIYFCPHCRSSWIYESDRVFEQRRKANEEALIAIERMKKIKDDGLETILDKLRE